LITQAVANNAKMSPDSRRNVIRTLVINGYVLESFETPTPGTSLIRVRKTDSLGAPARSLLLFADVVSAGLQRRLLGDAKLHNSTPIVVSTAGRITLPNTIRCLRLREFYQLLGGEVRTDRIFDPKLKSIMTKLGHNKLPRSFAGRPDDLLEMYCQESLQFLLQCPVRRYGQERRFEKLPDGLALGRTKLNICFDAKSYGKRFQPSANDIRQFASYVIDLNNHYSSYVGPISLFLVISGSFSSDEVAIKEKIDDFPAMCGTPMVFMRAQDLASAVQLARPVIGHRSAINWRRILVPYTFEPKRLRDELSRIRKDRVVT
jgi:hypothetical protein